jgi:F-box-like
MITDLGAGTDQLSSRVTSGELPDNVLLEVFDFYLALMKFESFWLRLNPEDAWHTLVHVCKRWRSIAFTSPHRLQLKLLCTNTNKRLMQNTLDIWPELPIVMRANLRMADAQDANHIIAVLEQHHRVCQIDIDFVQTSFIKKIRTMRMENPFSVLTSLLLHSQIRNVPALPDSFLGGSTPRLQTLSLDSISFPALPNLLLSTHDLVELHLWNIPRSGYISPEALVTCLSALTRLQSLRLGFESPRPRADRETRLVPRLTRLVLPSLTSLHFKGDSECLEDIVAQIDTPLLTWFKTTFFNQLIFNMPLFLHFISRTEIFKAPREAQVTFREGEVEVGLYLKNGDSFHKISSLAILCRPSDWQLGTLAQVCDSALSPLSTLELLEIRIWRSWRDQVENAQWLELLHSFTSMKDLVLNGKLIRHVALVLEQLARERVTEALPALQNILLQGPQPSEPIKKAIGKFVAERQLSGHPVAVHHRTLPSLTWQQIHLEAGD